MKYIPSLVVAGLVLAATAFSSTADSAPKLDLSEARTVAVAHTASADEPRVYCYSGVKAEADTPGVKADTLYRGWICVTENPATAAH